MSKNVAILEGTAAKRFNNVKKIQTHNVNGGTDYWVPEDDVKLGTKHITKNGTYKASEEENEDGTNKGWYGYSQVTVSGIGKVTGLDENDDEVEVSVGPDGKLQKKYSPASIAFITPPIRLYYNEGDIINLAGAQVQAFMKNGDPWEGDEDHPGGLIPFNELKLIPAVASAEGGSNT